jgi:H/ACA ribonucleoprotein complex subunit 2
MAKDKSEKKRKTELGDADISMVSAPDLVDESERVRICATFSSVLTDCFRQSSKKVKKEKEEVEVNVADLSPLAHPLAQKKLVKKLHKTIKKGAILLCCSHRINIEHQFLFKHSV